MGLQPIDQKKLTENTANVYEAVIVAAKKAKIINTQRKKEYDELKASVVSYDDEFDERVSPELRQHAMEVEKKLKPHIQALHELINGEISFRYKTDTIE